MRRALDAAKSALDALSDRDAILDCFFEHGRGLFQFSVLFVVRGDVAQGRNVDGLGAHDDLVTRTSLPVTGEPGILQRAHELRRPFVLGAGITPADSRLFGSLGRAMPAGVAVPLVLRDRVVAIFLGDGPAEALQRRGVEAGRTAVELAKDEMLLWSEAVGSALERLILRRKGGGSMRPPAFDAPRFDSAPPPPRDFDPSAPQLPRPPAMPSSTLTPDGEEVLDEQPWPDAEVAPEPPPRRVPMILAGAGVFAALLLSGAAYLRITRAESATDRIVTPAAKLPGFPRVDPAAVLDAARAASGAGARAELASVQAEVGRDARVDLAAKPKNADGIALSYVFVTPDTEITVRVDGAGVHGPVLHPPSNCGDRPCRVPVPAPKCTSAQIREATAPLGLAADDTALLTYAGGRETGLTPEAGPGWTLAVVDRGTVHLDGTTCASLPRERLLPAALPVAGVPGAPREVEPMKILPLARVQSGLEADAILINIEARHVNAAGKIDVTSADGGMYFTFADPPTIAVASRRWREVQLDGSGLRIKALNEGLPIPSRFASDLKPPTCSFAHAIKTAGAIPADATATVRYSRGFDGGQFEISVASIALRRTISDAECAAWEKLSRK